MNRLLNNEAGFSTLEAILAVALLAVALLPLYQFQLTINDASFRLEAQNDRRNSARLAETYLRSVQPSTLADGAASIGDARLSWTVEPLKQDKPVLNSGGLSGRFSISLIRVSYRVETDSAGVVTGELTRLSWFETTDLFSP